MRAGTMDSTLKSNLSVGLPLDLLVTARGELRSDDIVCIDEHNPYFQMIQHLGPAPLREVFEGIDDPRWDAGGDAPAPLRGTKWALRADAQDHHAPDCIIVSGAWASGRLRPVRAAAQAVARPGRAGPGAGQHGDLCLRLECRMPSPVFLRHIAAGAVPRPRPCCCLAVAAHAADKSGLQRRLWKVQPGTTAADIGSADVPRRPARQGQRRARRRLHRALWGRPVRHAAASPWRCAVATRSSPRAPLHCEAMYARPRGTVHGSPPETAASGLAEQAAALRRRPGQFLRATCPLGPPGMRMVAIEPGLPRQPQSSWCAG